ATLESIFGWNRAFDRNALDPEIFDLMEHDEALEGESGRYKSKVRFATVDELIFAHSGFPTADAVPFEPHAYRFVRPLLPSPPRCPLGRAFEVGRYRERQRGWRNCRGSVARQAHWHCAWRHQPQGARVQRSQRGRRPTPAPIASSASQPPKADEFRRSCHFRRKQLHGAFAT